MEHSHSRIPVYKEDLDHIIGIITVHDILRLTNKTKSVSELGDLHYQDFIVVPKTKSINKLFLEFKKRRQHIAIVVDEHGRTVGLVTLEDILEEIVGEIADEQDKEVTRITPIGKNEWEVSGETTIEELNGAIDMEIDFPVHKTVSLLILEILQGFPRLGERIDFQGVSLQVKSMGKNRIDKVIVSKILLEDNKNK
jgi:CBS domain containing-hemolysin-like protein